MNTKLLYIFTRTPLHVGAGSSVGAVDQPVQRERHTGYPIIPGSSIKGVLADGNGYIERDSNGKLILEQDKDGKPVNGKAKRTEIGNRIFGREAQGEKDQGESGELSFSEAKLLAFPVRSAQGCFAWVTSSHLLKRWGEYSGTKPELEKTPQGLEAYYNKETLGDVAVFEDYAMQHQGEVSDEVMQCLTPLVSDSLWKDTLKEHLAIVSDDMLAHFARSCCEVAQHVVIDDETGASKEGLLFNQENVPADTLFYSIITEVHNHGALNEFKVEPLVQFGGNATTGLGFCSISLS